jgi:hypothetical protein
MGERMDGGVMLMADQGERTRIAWRRRLTSRAVAAAAALAAGSVLVSCSPVAPTAGAGAASRSGGVVSLTGISTLRSLFNRDNGHPRLVLIFSPT